MQKKIIKTLLATVLLSLLALPGHAEVYYFNTADSLGTWSGDTTMPGYGSIEITEIGGYVHFEIMANSDFFISDPSEESDLTWDKFYFNFNPEKTLDTDLIHITSSGTWNIDVDQNSSMFGIFDYGTIGTSLPHAVDPLNFWIEDSSLEILDFVYPSTADYLFAGHLRRFGDGNEDSIQLAVAPVPEPGTLILIGSGLSGLLLYRRRRSL